MLRDGLDSVSSEELSSDELEPLLEEESLLSESSLEVIEYVTDFLVILDFLFDFYALLNLEFLFATILLKSLFPLTVIGDLDLFEPITISPFFIYSLLFI